VAGVSLALLGCFEAKLRPGGFVSLPKKTQALLAYLGLRPGQAYARDHLAALLWGETGDKQAYKSLRQAMYVLHKALPATGPPILLTRSATIALDPTAVDVDVPTFERLLAEGTPDALQQAAALYRGDLVEGLNVDEASFQEWLTVERERLRELALEVLGKLLAHHSSAGQTERGIQTAVRLLALDPLQESVHRALMQLYAAQGRRGAALKQYQLCVAAVQRELGTEPEPATRQFYQEILQRRSVDAPKIAMPHRRPVVARPRLGPESESTAGPIKPDAPLVGREPELSRLRTALDAAERGNGQVVAIVGEAGIGKSSVLMALAAHARSRDVRGLLGFSYESEQVLAFGP
jgi:DNA-binding SARP family transcriptional activator